MTQSRTHPSPSFSPPNHHTYPPTQTLPFSPSPNPQTALGRPKCPHFASRMTIFGPHYVASTRTHTRTHVPARSWKSQQFQSHTHTHKHTGPPAVEFMQQKRLSCVQLQKRTPSISSSCDKREKRRWRGGGGKSYRRREKKEKEKVTLLSASK